MNILVIEDDADLCVEIVEYLERRDHRVSGCGTVAVARQVLAELVGKAALDGVVCDVGLPDGDGLRLYIESVALTPNCRWILMSGGHDMERLRVVLRDLKIKPVVLEKPLPLKLLCDALEEGHAGQGSPN
jgi:DNA-binding response OmpR family regulator